MGAQNRYKMLCDGHDPKLCAQALLKGELAPFSGQLYTTEKAVQEAQKANWCDRETDYALRKEQQLSDGRLKLAERLHVIDVIALEEQVTTLKDHSVELHVALAKAKERSWDENDTLWFFVGVGSAVLSVFGGAKLVKAAK